MRQGVTASRRALASCLFDWREMAVSEKAGVHVTVGNIRRQHTAARGQGDVETHVASCVLLLDLDIVEIPRKCGNAASHPDLDGAYAQRGRCPAYISCSIARFGISQMVGSFSQIPNLWR